MTMLCSLVNVPVLADSYNWPLYENTYISSYFGGRIHPLTGKAQNHSGIDIPASKGTEVHAANSGTVYIMCTSCTHNYGKSSSCGCGGGYGNYLYIQHGDGLRTYYCHLTSITVENGSHVSTGDVVGTVGSTGSSTGFHLHFEMRNGASNNTRIDPLNYVSSGEVVPDVTYNDPIFNLDSCSGGVGTVSVRGWAFDDDDISQSIPVHVYVGGPAGDPNAEGYPIIADVFRDDVNIAYGCGNYHGFDASIKVTKTGTQPIYIYACNIGSGSTQLIAQKTLTITSPDTEVPVITNARIENVTNQGYDVICNVTDNLNVNRVQFVTWSDNNGQDDIAQGWDSNPIKRHRK